VAHTYVRLTPGDPAPWFEQRTSANPRFAFHTVAGRHVVLCFLGNAKDEQAQRALAAARGRPRFFDDETACFFAVTSDPEDLSENRVSDHYPGYRVFWDFDGAVSGLYGSLPREAQAGQGSYPYRRQWVVLDPLLRVARVFPFSEGQQDFSDVLAYLDDLPPPARFAGVEIPAPILFLPNVFDADLCARLVKLYDAEGGQESGFMRQVDGKTVLVEDHSHKRRRDYLIKDKALITETQTLFNRKVVPEIRKAHQFVATRMERYIVACYAAEDEAHFRPHRDNTTKGTAHRRFAATVNLTNDYDGGDLSFPEYGPRQYRPPIGAAVVFSCSLLHAVSRVTRGKRYAFLPFLYDETAAKAREQNNPFLAEGLGEYRA
jgi:predicted 2-oxoglutarate/Fe(II)-dependent dioxygenase YbiX/peroxiredoxin